MAEANNLGYELGWDDQIEKDGLDFVTLPKGIYKFVVTKFERARYTPTENAKLPPCNMAVVHLEFDGGEAGTCIVKHKLFLHSSTEGFLCSFFNSIGQRKPGERIVMNWNTVPMARGRAELKIRNYKKDGEDLTINEVSKFLDYDPVLMNATPPAPTGYAQQAQTYPAGYPAQQGYPVAPVGYAPPPAYAPPAGYPAGNAPQAPQPGYPTQPPAGFEPGRF